MSYAEHTQNFAHQSKSFATVNAVCEQAILYAEHTENSVPYPDIYRWSSSSGVYKYCDSSAF